MRTVIIRYSNIYNQIKVYLIRLTSSLLHNCNFWVVTGGYTQTQTEGACCISENTYHRYCACAGKAISWCRDFCDNDLNCKGYFEYTPQTYCRVSTTTTSLVRLAAGRLSRFPLFSQQTSTEFASNCSEARRRLSLKK